LKILNLFQRRTNSKSIRLLEFVHVKTRAIWRVYDTGASPKRMRPVCSGNWAGTSGVAQRRSAVGAMRTRRAAAPTAVLVALGLTGCTYAATSCQHTYSPLLLSRPRLIATGASYGIGTGSEGAGARALCTPRHSSFLAFVTVQGHAQPERCRPCAIPRSGGPRAGIRASPHQA